MSGDAPAGCPFCRIVAGTEPAEIVHADPTTVAFLDTRPVFGGHVLLVPRQHVTTLADLPAGQHGHFLGIAQRLETAVEKGLDADGSLLIVNNRVSQSVPHLHLHVIPRRFRDGLRFWLGPRHPYPDDAARAATAARIRAALPAGAT